MKERKILVVLSSLFIMFLVACASTPPKPNPAVSPISPLPTPVAGPLVRLTPISGKSALSGKVISVSALAHPPLANTIVRLARVYWNDEKKDGAFVLDGANSPGTITNESGEFFFANLDPGDYVVVVGDVQVNSSIVSNEDGSAKVFTTNQSEILDVGTLESTYTP